MRRAGVLVLTLLLMGCASGPDGWAIGESSSIIKSGDMKTVTETTTNAAGQSITTVTETCTNCEVREIDGGHGSKEVWEAVMSGLQILGTLAMALAAGGAF